jgi:hypothetical protein
MKKTKGPKSRETVFLGEIIILGKYIVKIYKRASAVLSNQNQGDNIM